MAALALHPSLAEFLDEVLHHDSHGVAVEDGIAEKSAAVSRTPCDLLGPTGQSLVIATGDRDRDSVADPAADTTVAAGSVLMVLESAEDRATLVDRVR